MSEKIRWIEFQFDYTMDLMIERCGDADKIERLEFSKSVGYQPFDVHICLFHIIKGDYVKFCLFSDLRFFFYFRFVFLQFNSMKLYNDLSLFLWVSRLLICRSDHTQFFWKRAQQHSQQANMQSRGLIVITVLA